eukprot:CAMPEP_0194490720 /NCGR_PEP_ID=MMETSP0253-20130528/9839_1 /TAXON_ID=2966 /ORGANISM="Noctiluca scintillans" /LENGTH=280 /DNA_ID=CAMNT_0039331379 /DNA_START=217 /DNA_END=1056 /DNA_ORIENTATION=+
MAPFGSITTCACTLNLLLNCGRRLQRPLRSRGGATLLKTADPSKGTASLPESQLVLLPFAIPLLLSNIALAEEDPGVGALVGQLGLHTASSNSALRTRQRFGIETPGTTRELQLPIFYEPQCGPDVRAEARAFEEGVGTLCTEGGSRPLLTAPRHSGGTLVRLRASPDREARGGPWQRHPRQRRRGLHSCHPLSHRRVPRCAQLAPHELFLLTEAAMPLLAHLLRHTEGIWASDKTRDLHEQVGVDASCSTAVLGLHVDLCAGKRGVPHIAGVEPSACPW